MVTVFLFLNKTLGFENFESANFKYDNIFSKIACQKYLNKLLLAPNWNETERWTLYFDKLECVNLKYDNCFCKFEP